MDTLLMNALVYVLKNEMDSLKMSVLTHPFCKKAYLKLNLVSVIVIKFLTHFAFRGFFCFQLLIKCSPGKMTTGWRAEPSAQTNSRTVMCSLLTLWMDRACLDFDFLDRITFSRNGMFRGQPVSSQL